jgi:hypothetical protein
MVVHEPDDASSGSCDRANATRLSSCPVEALNRRLPSDARKPVEHADLRGTTNGHPFARDSQRTDEPAGSRLLLDLDLVRCRDPVGTRA